MSFREVAPGGVSLERVEMPKARAPHQKRVPTRTCIACRRSDGKRPFVRVVRTADLGVTVDLSGKLPGRGAYICRVRSCWEIALSSHRLEPALKTTLTAEELAALRSYSGHSSRRTRPAKVIAELYDG